MNKTIKMVLSFLSLSLLIACGGELDTQDSATNDSTNANGEVIREKEKEEDSTTTATVEPSNAIEAKEADGLVGRWTLTRDNSTEETTEIYLPFANDFIVSKDGNVYKLDKEPLGIWIDNQMTIKYNYNVTYKEGKLGFSLVGGEL